MRFSRQGLKNAIGIAVAAAGLACALVSAMPGSARADDPPIVGVIDQARLVKIPEGTDTLIIGNSTIADVTLLKQKNLMVLTPKAFGETNFIALDANGNPLAGSIIRVINGTDALIVQSGAKRQSYSCAPKCQPTERLGDDTDYLGIVTAQNVAHVSRLAGASTSAPTQPGLMSPH